MFATKKAIVFLLTLVIVGFGQPVWSSWLSLLASLGGYALFWSILLDQPAKQRFWVSSGWMALVQFIQLFWMTSHPFLYIYAVHICLSLGIGLQFGLIGLCLTRERLNSLPHLFAISGLWTLMEWSRLFLLAGYSFNPVGLALSAHFYPLQAASLVGIYGLSFWTIFVNLLALRAWIHYRKAPAILWLSAAALPFLYGFAQTTALSHPIAPPTYSALLIQPAFPSEEAMTFDSHAARLAYVIDEWHQILALAKREWGKPTDLIALPEFAVPYGTYTPVFPYLAVKTAFSDIFGQEAVKKLPALEAPLAQQVDLTPGKMWFVNNAYWLQALANLFDAEVVSGLEDAEDMPSGVREYYSAAVHVRPGIFPGDFIAGRYEKRILMPMGEYIPFAFCRSLAAAYGIQGSFTHGKEAKVLGCRQPLGMCICYEETFGHMIRENSHKGAKILVNLTNDGWYPNSLLPQQHFDHARLRTVENGLPLLRSCNTGVTGAIDCFGRTIATLDNSQEAPGALHVTVPLYSFPTLYRTFGDMLIVCVSFASLLFFFKKQS